MSRDRGHFAQVADSIERHVAGGAMKKTVGKVGKQESKSKGTTGAYLKEKDTEFHREGVVLWPEVVKSGGKKTFIIERNKQPVDSYQKSTKDISIEFDEEYGNLPKQIGVQRQASLEGRDVGPKKGYGVSQQKKDEHHFAQADNKSLTSVPKVVDYDKNDRGRNALGDSFATKSVRNKDGGVKIDEGLDERNVDEEEFSLDATDRFMIAGVEALNFDDVPVAGYHRGMSDEEFAHRKRIYANRLENIQNYKSAIEAVNEWRSLIQKYYKQNFKAYKSQESRFVNAEDQTIKIFYNMLTHYNTAIDGGGARESRVLEYLRDALFKAVENIDQGIKDPKVAEAARLLRDKIGSMLDALLHYQISIEQKAA